MEKKLLNRIISVAYNDASLWEKFQINRLARYNSEVRAVLDEYKKVSSRTHNLKFEELPHDLHNKVKSITKVEANRNNPLLFDLYSFVFNRPAVSASILSLFILALVSTFIIKRPEIHQQYSQQEIELANQQAKHSLALIASVFKKTTATVQDDILTNRVSKPIKESFNLVNDYIQGENNEKVN